MEKMDFAKWNTNGDRILENGKWKSDGRIEHGNLLPDNTMAKTYIDTSLTNFGNTTVTFQLPKMKHPEFAKGDGVVGAKISFDRDAAVRAEMHIPIKLDPYKM